MPNITNITPPRVPMVDPATGLVTRDWYRFFANLFRLTGAGTNTATLDDLQIGPDFSGLGSTEFAVLASELQALNLSPPTTPQLVRHRYGSFYDTTTQTAAATNTPYAMKFNTTQFSQGVTIGTPTSRIYVDTVNIYNIQFSAQINTTVSTDHLLWIWLRKNGADVADSATQIRTKGNDFASVAAWNFLLDMNQGDYFELMWAADSTGIQLQTFAASAFYPAIPSILLTVTNNISSNGG